MGEVYHSTPTWQINTFWHPTENRFFSVPKLTKQNPEYRHDQAIQYVLQFKEEGIERYGYVNSELWKSYKRWLWKEEIRHKYFPLPKVVAVVSNLGNHELPERPHKRVWTVEEWIKNSVGRIDGTKGFGGIFKGSKPPRPPSNVKCVILHDDVDLDVVRETLSEDGRKWTMSGESVCLLDMDEKTAKEYVERKFISYP